MENLNEIKDNIVDNAVKIKDNVVDNIKDFKENIENNVGIPAATAQPKNFLDYSKEFLQSNTIIAKATFLLLVIILFVFLFRVLSKIIIFFMTPSETPYLLYGMKDATQTLTVPQSFKNKGDISEQTYSLTCSTINFASLPVPEPKSRTFVSDNLWRG